MEKQTESVRCISRWCILSFMTSFLNPTYIIAILIAISVHEWAHAFVADRFGDPTPRNEGRLTVNPLAHLDMMGALMFLVIGFGWAKPVPVNSSYFRHPKRDMSLVALAGPVSNFILAIIAFTLIFVMNDAGVTSATGLLDQPQGINASAVFLKILQDSLFVNLALMAFNLFPLAPLDGSNILHVFIPYQYERKYEEIMQIGPYILFGIILVETIFPVRIISAWVFTIMDAVLALFQAVAHLL